MKRTEFDNYFNDQNVFKLPTQKKQFALLNKENGIILNFMFAHQGFYENALTRDEDKKRIIFEICKKDEYPGKIDALLDSSEALFLVNSHEPDYAMLFKSEIDKQKREVKLNLIDFTELAESSITKKEKDGILLNF